MHDVAVHPEHHTAFRWRNNGDTNFLFILPAAAFD
jgi:hypothetical protein